MSSLAEIVENLHRREIGAEERAALIRAYAERLKERDQLPPVRQPVASVASTRRSNAGNQPGVTAKVAKDLGVTKRTVQRALSGKKPDQPPVKAEPAAASPAPSPSSAPAPSPAIAPDPPAPSAWLVSMLRNWANGLRVPIVTIEGEAGPVILDGRNRYRACVEAGVEPRFESYAGDKPGGLRDVGQLGPPAP